MSSNIARLGAILGINTTEFKKGLDEADAKSKKFRQELRDQKQGLKDLETTAKTAAALIGAAFVGLGAAALRAADEISDLADANDVTIDKILELRSALVKTGGDADKVGQLFSSFTNAVDGAAGGSDKLQKAFAQVGVSLTALATNSNEELLNKAFAGLAKIEDPIRRNAIAMDLFGKAAKGVDWRNMAGAAEEVRGRFAANADAIKSAAETFQNLALFAQDAYIAMAQVLKPFTDFVNKIPSEDRVENLAKWFKYLGEVMLIAFGVKAVLGVVKLSNALVALGKKNPWILALTAAGAAVGYVAPEVFGGEEEKDSAYPEGPKKTSQEAVRREVTVSSEAKKTKEEIAAMREKIDLMRNIAIIDSRNSKALGVRRNKYEEGMASAGAAHEKELLQIEHERREALRKDDLTEEKRQLIKEMFDARRIKSIRDHNEEVMYQLAMRNKEIESYEAETQFIAKQNALEAQGLELANKVYEMDSWAVARAQEEEALAKRLLDIEKQRDIAKREHAPMTTERFLAEERLNAQAEAEKRASAIRQRGIAEDEARAHSWSAGWEGAMKKFSDDAKLYGKVGADAFNSVVGNMNSAIDNFVRTGKFAFKDFAKSIILDLLAMELKFQAMVFLRYALGPIGIGLSSLPGKAEGGDVTGGSPYIVGERGPELFVPNGSGTIIPNNQLATAGGGPQVVYNGPYIASMNAIDTQSATQFLAKNKSAVWAANQSAQRSVPVSR